MVSQKTLLRGLALLASVLILISAVAAEPSAQTARTDLQISGLIAVSPFSPFTGETVQFFINQSTFFFYNLHLRTIFAVEWDFGDGTIVRSCTLGTMSHSYAFAGQYTVRLRIFTAPFVIYNTAATVNVTARPTPGQVGTIEFIIMQYDFNRDNRLSDLEFFTMIDAWIGNIITNSVFFAAVDLWVRDGVISGLAVSGARLDRDEFRALAIQRPDDVVFAAQGDFETLAVRVYDASGNLIFSDRASGNRLVWSLRADGTPVANGVYYYALDARAADGSVERNPLKAFSVMR